MRLLQNVIEILYNGLPHPKGQNYRHGHQMQIRRLLGYPCKVNLYHSNHATSKTTRRFRDKIEWVHTYSYDEMVIRSSKMKMVVKPNLYASLDMIPEIGTNGSTQWLKRRSKRSPTSYISQKRSKTIEKGVNFFINNKKFKTLYNI